MPFHLSTLDEIHLDHSVATIGAFDGIHLGHQSIIDHVKDYAHQSQVPSVVISFFPHPLVVLRQLQEPFYLTFPEQRASILFDLGVDYVITLPFTKQLSEFTPNQFIQWTHQSLGYHRLCIGEDFALGRGREGTPNTLKEIGNQLGYELVTIPPVIDSGEKISSSRIRKLLREGNTIYANKLLGRPYRVLGKNNHFINHKMRHCGITTLQMTTRTMQLLPSPGAYLVRILGETGYFPAVAEINTASQNDTSARFIVYLIEARTATFEFDNVGIEFLQPFPALQTSLSLSDKYQTITANIDFIREEAKDD